MKHLSLLVTAAILFAVPAIAQGPKVDLIHLDPQPAISGGCPAKVHLTGKIRATGPLEVTYRWLRSDGSHTQHTLNFSRAMTENISTDWTLNKTTPAWMQLVILSPKQMQTAKANFSVNCK